MSTKERVSTTETDIGTSRLSTSARSDRIPTDRSLLDVYPGIRMDMLWTESSDADGIFRPPTQKSSKLVNWTEAPLRLTLSDASTDTM